MEKVTERLRDIYGGRKWIVTAPVAANTVNLIKALVELGGEPLVVAVNEGVGEVPDVPIVWLEVAEGIGVVDGFRNYHAALAEPNAEVIMKLDHFDPAWEAMVLTPPFSDVVRPLHRRAYGPRRPEWTALEDKLAAEEVWADAGIATAPHEIVPPEEAPSAADRLATEMGTVWVADNRTGWHGGGEYVRWVHSDQRYEETIDWFAERACLVRVMPFLEGLPCSIHGYVGNDHVAVVRPVEILIMRKADRSGFLYGGVSTRWDPPVELSEEMTTAARKVGSHLRSSVGYLGAFGMDGVATAEGWRPTELNPRTSGGFANLPKEDGYHFGLASRAFIEGDLDLNVSELETTWRELAEERRFLRVGVPVEDQVETVETALGLNDGSLVQVNDNSDAKIGAFWAGPSVPGSYLFFRFDAEKVGVGPPMAPLAAESVRFASRFLSIDLPEVEPATDVTR